MFSLVEHNDNVILTMNKELFISFLGLTEDELKEEYNNNLNEVINEQLEHC